MCADHEVVKIRTFVSRQQFHLIGSPHLSSVRVPLQVQHYLQVDMPASRLADPALSTIGCERLRPVAEKKKQPVMARFARQPIIIKPL